jgi:hypothetical protein
LCRYQWFIHLTLVRGITPEIEERLAEEAILDAAALAMANPHRLLRNTPFHERQILQQSPAWPSRTRVGGLF